MVTHEALPEVYRQHDVLVFPSICHEGLPMTLLEAMACGLAVVGTTTGGSSEILQHEVNALTFPPCDSVSFADCLFRLVHEPALVRSLATAGQQMVSERFSIDSLITQTEDFLKEVCSNHSHNFTFACRSSF
jgi:glycosyltransferase involved in cell wall biosynthesis